jgi:trehalose-phosphatase
MLDVDGTLAPLVSHPSLAVVPHDTRRAVAALTAIDGAHVAIVSGRAAADARRMVAVPHAWTIGNHGAEVVSPDGDVEVDPEISAYGDAIDQAARSLAPLLAPMTHVLLENKGWSVAIHYRMADPTIVGRLRMTVESIAAGLGLRVVEGKAILELRPPVQVDKGTAIYRLGTSLGALGPDATIIYIGDDTTDEDAFRLLRARVPHATTIFVGGEDRPTAAEFRVPDTDAVRQLLVSIAHLAR